VTYLGIDGGGSKTVFLLVDEGDSEVCRVVSGPSNWLSVGPDAAAAAIRDGVSRLKGDIPVVVCGGFAGAGRPEGLAFYRQVLEPLFPNSKVRIESDACISYIGSIGLTPGVLLIAGTGSIAIGRTPDGSMIRIGGWGPHFGDEGSGFWIGREAVRIALRSLDSGHESPFASRIAASLNLHSIKDVVAAWSSGSIGVPQIAGIFPDIISMWPDEPAAEIIRTAAKHLKSLTETAVARIPVPHCPVCASGSVATNKLIRQLIGIAFEQPMGSPEFGAVMLAKSASEGCS